MIAECVSPVSATPLKTCAWDKNLFIPLKSASKYCSDYCRTEASKESKRNRDRKYYKTNKKSLGLRQIGTTTIGVHPNKNFEREAKIISNEKRRAISVVTRYKGLPKNSIHHYTYDNIKSDLKEYGDPQPLGIQNTHNYSKFNDYINTSTELIMKQAYSGRECPECNNNSNFHKDRSRAEISCTGCGLVLIGPPVNGITYPWKVIYLNGQCEKCMEPFSYDAERECYEPYQCPECGHYNHILDWD